MTCDSSQIGYNDTPMTTNSPTPDAILQTAFGFWNSKVLLTAVTFDLFTVLGQGRFTGPEIGREVDLHPRGVADFLDALVAMKFLEREGDGPDGRYRNTPDTAAFLDKNSPAYIGGILEMANARLYRFWGDLSEGLRTGAPQNEIKHTGASVFDELYSKPERLEQFMEAMAGISAANFQAFAEKFDFSRYQTLCDIGGATGLLCIEVAKKHPYLQCVSFDLPPVEPRWGLFILLLLTVLSDPVVTKLQESVDVVLLGTGFGREMCEQGDEAGLLGNQN